LLRLLAWLENLREEDAAGAGMGGLRKRLRRRLEKLRRSSVEAGRRFERLPEADRHSVRKRVKRLRYLSEMARPLFDGDAVDRFVGALKPLQDALGAYQDAAAAKLLWREHTTQDPLAWFGAGWLSAREEHLAELCGKACRRASKDLRPFW
jgi:triphosphatase